MQQISYVKQRDMQLQVVVERCVSILLVSLSCVFFFVIIAEQLILLIMIAKWAWLAESTEALAKVAIRANELSSGILLFKPAIVV